MFSILHQSDSSDVVRSPMMKCYVAFVDVNVKKKPIRYDKTGLIVQCRYVARMRRIDAIRETESGDCCCGVD